MVTLRSNNLKRTIAMLIAMILLLGMLPIPGVTAATGNHPSAVTISVKDSDGVAISGASVHYAITGEAVETIDNTKQTDEYGTIEVLASEDFVEGTYKIGATVSCDTYVAASLSEQSITSADQDFVVTMEKEQTEPDPEPITGITVTATEEKYTGSEFPAVEISGTQAGDVVTVTVNGNATVLNANGSNMPKIKEVGSYKVKVDVTREGYAGFTQTVTSVISKNILDIRYEGITKEYVEGKEYAAIKLASGSTLPAVDSITYKLGDGEASAVIPKISAVGTYTIHVHAEKAGYEDFNQDYTSEITLGTIDDSNVTITGLNSVYNSAAQQLVTITGTDKDLFTYTLSIAGEEATYSDPAELTKVNAGEYEVTVTLSRANYANKNVLVTATIEKADQTLKFTDGYVDGKDTSKEFNADNTENNQYNFAAEIESGSDGAITYSIENAESGDAPTFATIDKNGLLTFTAAGTVIVTATQAGNENYKSVSITHIMSISQNKGLIKFAGDSEENYVFGTNDGLVSKQQLQLSDPRDSGELSFEFQNQDAAKESGLELVADTQKRIVQVKISDYSKLNSALEKNDQKISVVVVANKKAVLGWNGRVKFAADTASYTITITYETLSANTPYTLKENAKDKAPLDGPNGANGWYDTKIVVLPAEGYTLAREINKNADNFDENVTIVDQGEEEKYIYLRNTKTTGGICAKVPLNGLKIDSVNPTDCTVEYKDPSVGKTILRALSLGFYQSSVEVTFTANDATSGVAYFKWWYVREEGVNENNAPSMREEDAHTVLATPITEDVKDEETEEIHTVIKGYTATITLTTKEYNQMRGKIFAVAVDFAGHESDESNDDTGFVLDDINPTMTLKYTEANRIVGNKKYYNNQIDFTLQITENNFFSEDVNVTVNGVETSVTWSKNDSSSNLHTGNFTIGTEKDGDYTVKIDYEDKSTNPMKPEKTYTLPYTLVIDTTKPVITPTYQNASMVGTDRYYNQPATLALTFTEANFFQEDVQIEITREDGGTSQAAVAWEKKSDDEHVATIIFPAPAGGGADGHYTVTANYTDPSGNRMTTFASDRITVDTIAPTISVSYDNNDLTSENYFTETENAKFFKAGREATITIVEHNFEPNKVTISAVAAGHGAETPAISGWTDSRDTHTAKVTFSADGDYTFDVSAIDAAENKNGDVEYGNSAARKEFTIDTNPDMIVIAPDSVVEGKAYTYDDVIIPDITISDDNLEGYEITLKGVQRGNEIDLTEQVNDLVKNEDNLATALLDVFSKKAELDGIYTLTVRSTDLSDNTDEKVIRFTVNRFGSVYEYSDSLMDLIENGGTYNRSLDEDLTFTIYNASPIDPNNVSVVITRDGRPVEAIFTVIETTADDDGWYSYLVTINKGNFAEDGVYTVSVTTTDDADNTVENTVDNSDGDILFYVDSTAPQLTSVSGLEERIVNATELEVSYTVYDTIGLASVQVKVDGEIVDSATDFDDASNYSGKFTIYEKSSEQHVSFVLTDKAGNVTESDAEGFEVPYTLEKDVTVSTNLFVRWFANKPLFFGGIGGGVAVLGGLGALLGLKKKKKVKVS